MSKGWPRGLVTVLDGAEVDGGKRVAWFGVATLALGSPSPHARVMLVLEANGEVPTLLTDWAISTDSSSWPRAFAGGREEIDLRMGPASTLGLPIGTGPERKVFDQVSHRVAHGLAVELVQVGNPHSPAVPDPIR
jgi:hypothetical protein